MTSHSIKPAKLADAVVDHIQRMILEGVLKPGDRLCSERELSSKLDVSRPTLREALNKLIQMNLIAADARGICYISDSVGQSFVDPLALLLDDPEGRIDCAEFRAVVEAAAAGLAAERASNVDRERMTKQFERLKVADKKADIDELATADAEFHLAIFEASHNLVMLQVMRSFDALLQSNIHLMRSNPYVQRRAFESQLAEHRAIYEAIMAGDRESAERAARYHMASNVETQRAIQDAERRLKASMRRLTPADIVAPDKTRTKAPTTIRNRVAVDSKRESDPSQRISVRKRA